MDTDVVFDAGAGAAKLGPAAAQIATSALHGYDTAAGVVHHPVLTAAFHAFADTHAKLHHSFASRVTDGGARLAKGSNAVSDAENDATHLHQQSFSVAEHVRHENGSALR
ncbi:MAG TPA: hypothetical protein VH419_07850 [Nocardioidaceae bacterium]